MVIFYFFAFFEGEEKSTASISPDAPSMYTWFSSLFQGSASGIDGLNKPRKVPVKIEPKVFFAVKTHNIYNFKVKNNIRLKKRTKELF